MHYKNLRTICLGLLLFVAGSPVYSQRKTTSDQLLRLAHKAAYTDKNYPKAKAYLFRALRKSPNYADVKVLLGRIYTWTDQPDSGRYYFTSVLKRKPSYEDASIAYADLEYKYERYDKSASIASTALKYHPSSKALLLRKRKAQQALKESKVVVPKPVLDPSPVIKPKTIPNNEPANSIPNNEPTNQPLNNQSDSSFSSRLSNQVENQHANNNPPLNSQNTNAPVTQPVSKQENTQASPYTNAPVNQPSVSTSNTQSNNYQPIIPSNNVNSPRATARQIGPVDSTTSDGLLQLARGAAFDQKNYPKAQAYLYRALAISPDYPDVLIFLGRTYAWTGDYNNAKINLDHAFKVSPSYEDAAIAYSDLEYWNNHYSSALSIVNQGLLYHPNSEDLLIRKAKIYRAMKDYPRARAANNQALKVNPNNLEARGLKESIDLEGVKNSIALSYDFSYFDHQFDAPWHLVALEYGRVTPLGKIIGRFSVANRFGITGTQFEIDAYPHISKTFYAYMNVGWGFTDIVFPRFRAGFSLYANLPAGFEAELGFRYLKFTGTPVWIYTAGLGKYYKNWLFGEKTYLVPSDYSSTVSASFTFTATYYIGGESYDNVIGGYIGFGISPDDRINVLLYNTDVVRESSFKLGVFYKKKFAKYWVLSLSQGIVRQEYLPGVSGMEYQFGIGLLKRF